MRCVSYRQQMVGCCFSIQSTSLCLLIGELRPLTSVITYSSFTHLLMQWDLFFPVFSWLLLSSPTVYKISLSIFYSAGLVITNSFSFYLLSMVYISWSIVKNSFAGPEIYVGNYFLSGIKINSLIPSLLLKFLLRNLLLFWCDCLYRWLDVSLLQFSVFPSSVHLIFNSPMPWTGSFLVLSVWCPKSLQYLDDHLFLQILGVFCDYFI
jgi:hypothetical protein